MIAADARILWQLLRGHPRSGDHAADLAGFYGAQADSYDQFRERLLPGRDALYADLTAQLPRQARLIELGAGTGRNLVRFGERLSSLASADLVDLCSPLLAQAQKRWQGVSKVRCHLADACTWQPTEAADVVTLVYALTMIPDWERALDNAIAMLKPGGMLAVVDFTLTPTQSPWARWFWKHWFAHDGVRLSSEHLAALAERLPMHVSQLGESRLPYLPGVRVPYYRFIGRKP